MPEIAPGGVFGANIDKPLNERSMVMQAWGAYGVLWPVVHQWLGVSPDMGRGRVAVVPQLPPDQPSASARSIKVGSGRLDVTARRTASGPGTRYATTVVRHGRSTLVVGAVLPRGTEVAARHRRGGRARAGVPRPGHPAGRQPGRARLGRRLRVGRRADHDAARARASAGRTTKP